MYIKEIEIRNFRGIDVQIKDLAKETIRIKDFGKWNNTNIFVQKRIPRTKYKPDDKWGMIISHLERLGTVSNEEREKNVSKHTVNYGVVIMFKTIDGTDARFEDFYNIVNKNDNYILRTLDLYVENEITIQAEKEQKLE